MSEPSSSSASSSQHGRGQDQGPSGLGMMPSMSAECTPLKHRYDECFNRWFEDYLGVGGGGGGHVVARRDSASEPANKSSSSSSRGFGGFFGRASSSSSDSASSSAASLSSSSSIATSVDGSDQTEPTPAERKRLRERLDGECGAMWKEYQQCVLRAVKEKDLEGSIAEARAHNPFPFPGDVPQGQRNNDPFPFPAGPGGR